MLLVVAEPAISVVGVAADEVVEVEVSAEVDKVVVDSAVSVTVGPASIPRP
jgi:hypothetical protein